MLFRFYFENLFFRREGSPFLVKCLRQSGWSVDFCFTKVISYTSVSRPMLVKDRRILRCSKTSLILSSPDKLSIFCNFCALAFYHKSTERKKWFMVLGASPSPGKCLLPWWSPWFWKCSGCGSWGYGLGWLSCCWAGGWTSWSWRSLPTLVVLWNAGNLMQCTKINEHAR